LDLVTCCTVKQVTGIKTKATEHLGFNSPYELSILAVLSEVTGLILNRYPIIAANVCRVNAINNFPVGSRMEREFRLRTINLMYCKRIAILEYFFVLMYTAYPRYPYVHIESTDSMIFTTHLVVSTKQVFSEDGFGKATIC